MFIAFSLSRFIRFLFTLCLAFLTVHAVSADDFETDHSSKPLMRDFMGINGHIAFKPELYREVCRLARSFHNISWDVAKPGDPVVFPDNAQGFNWERRVYGPWKRAGFEIDLCAQFSEFGAKATDDYETLWAGQGDWMEEYGYRLASYKGADGEVLFTSIEVGNEPGDVFDEKLYTTLFKGMARGIRRASPDIKIVTCTVKAGEADRWAMSLDNVFGPDDMQALYDVINVHTYALLPPNSRENPWERSYPEDKNTEYLTMVDDAIAWRDRNAPDKQVWITEFGWDAPSEDALARREGAFQQFKWQGETELNQAQWLVRSFLLFSERAVGRAYLYFYNDKDRPRVHASSGLTRNFVPKKSFWAVKHLYDTLGDYRFKRVVTDKKGELYVFEYEKEDRPAEVIWVAWSPTGSGRTEIVTLEGLPGRPKAVVRSPMAEGPAPKVQATEVTADTITLEITETPTYIML